jgi:segregation and condensation protein B
MSRTATRRRLLPLAARRHCAVRRHGSWSGYLSLGGKVLRERYRWLHRPGEPAADEGRPDAAARDAELARLEAILFLAEEPLHSRKLAQLADLADGTQARTLVRRLNACLQSSGAAFRVDEIAGGFQLLTLPQFAPWLRRLLGGRAEERLSGPALETLAIIAYRQPILRAEVEAIRGVQSGEMLRQLLERDLIRIAGRSEELGRPFLYATTRRFLQMFGLRSLDELPPVPGLRPGNDASLPTDHEIPREPQRLRDCQEESVIVRTATLGQPAVLDAPHANDPADPAARLATRRGPLEPQSAKDDEDLEDEEFEDEEDLEDEEFEDEEEFDEEFEDEEWEEVDDEEFEDEEEEDDWDEEDDDWDEEDDEDDWDDE